MTRRFLHIRHGQFQLLGSFGFIGPNCIMDFGNALIFGKRLLKRLYEHKYRTLFLELIDQLSRFARQFKPIVCIDQRDDASDVAS